MQAVILAAGKGVRMLPLTLSAPKPLLKVCGRPLIDYSFDALPADVDEVIVVIGYLGDQIRDYLKDNFKGRRVKYVFQEKLEGTAKALISAKDLLRNKFLVLMADDIYLRSDIERCLEYERAMLVMKTQSKGPGGKIVFSGDGKLENVIEGKDFPVGTIVSIGVYLLDSKIFDYAPVKLTDREGEWGLPQTVSILTRDFPVSVVEARQWLKITTPEDLICATKLLKDRKHL